MSFWHLWKQVDSWENARLRASEVVAAEIKTAIERDLAEGADPRHSDAVGELLSWLWNPDPIQSRVIRSLSYPPKRDSGNGQSALTMESAAFSKPPPATPEARYEAVSAALSAYIASHLMMSERQVETVHSSAGLHEAVLLVGRLRMADVHESLCRLLRAARQSEIIGSGAPSRLQTFQTLKSEIMDSLLQMPPDQVPGVWRRFAAFSTEELFYGFVKRLHDRRAVPPLLDVWPRLSDDAKNCAVTAFRNIRDTRAVPALQALAALHGNLLAPRAADAVAEILRGSRDDAAQLLRATDARHAGNVGETLLRPAKVTGATMRPDELLRPGCSAPGEKTRDYDTDP